MHVHDVFNINLWGFVWCVSVWAQECRGMHMEVRQLTEKGSLLPPRESWASACSSAFTYRTILLGLCLFEEYSFVSANTRVSKENWESTLPSRGFQEWSDIRFSTCTIILYSTSPSPLCFLWGGWVWDSLCHPNWPLTEQSLYLGLPSTEICICEPPCLIIAIL